MREENNIPAETLEEKQTRRKDRLKNIFKGKLWVLIILILIVSLGVYLRIQPMTLKGANPGLWDITTNTWTLGPDLDPWLFTRYAQHIVEDGNIPNPDMMRNVPLGYPTEKETRLLPYMIAGTYYFLNIFGDFSVIYAAVIFPVIMFVLTTIIFFLFAREIFIDNKLKANLIAVVSSLFFVTITSLLFRTIAGIPEKESAAFFFMFLTFYLFLKAWKAKTYKKYIPLGILAGISTGAMTLIWYGSVYVFMAIGIACFIAFIFNKVHKKETIVYALWVCVSFILMNLFSGRYPLAAIVKAVSTGIPFAILFILLMNLILSKFKFNFIEKSRIPRNIYSIIITIILFSILTSILFGYDFLLSKIRTINKILYKPITGRWGMTVAENRQPFLKEWTDSLGPYIANISIYLGLIFVGSVVFFKDMFSKIKNKHAWILTGLYVFFFIGITYTRYSASSIFNGTNFISKGVYFLSILLMFAGFVYFYIKYRKIGDSSFNEIKFEHILLFTLFVLTLITARGAVRLVMVLAAVSPIMIGYLCVIFPFKYYETYKKNIQDKVWKVLLIAVMVFIIIISIFTLNSFYKQTKGNANAMIPSYYNQQWQKAMYWVREETPKEAVFGFWWDYGYWMQSIGERATVLDGGNKIVYWNYLMGRHVLTGDNQDDALEFLYNHDTTHFLIDSSDIGKYSAYSIIGSDENFDRYSWMGTLLLDKSKTRETNNQTLLFYQGGVSFDEDLVINKNGVDILLPEKVAGIGAIILPQQDNKFQQPYIIVGYQGLQHNIQIRYLSIGGNFIDYGSGIEACAYVFPRLDVEGQSISQDSTGAVLYLSPRLMRGMMVQKYILDDPFSKFPNFKLVHSEPALFVDDLRKQGMELPDLVYFKGRGVLGPIKIWEIEYTGKEQIREEYLDTDSSKYISWEL